MAINPVTKRITDIVNDDGYIFRTLLFLFLLSSRAVHATTINVYLFPGQGADHRLFDNLELPEGYSPIYISYPTPEKGTSLKDFAQQLIPQIDTTEPLILIGVSLGGMICTELHDILNPLKTIVISSAKNRSEIPGKYRFMKSFPLYKILPPGSIKAGSFIAQPVVEPDRKKGKETFVAMLRDKDPDFLKRSIDMIIKWERTEYNPAIIHIHGNNDHTLPIRNISANHIVDKGSHMMVYTNAETINAILALELKSSEI